MDESLKFYHLVIAKAVTAFHYVRVGSLMLLFFVLHPTRMWPKKRPLPPACLTDSKHGTHKYITVNGVKLHYVEKGDPNKPLIVFVHGFPEFWYSWRHQLEEFSKDYWCVAIDCRGYGDSEKPKELSAYKLAILVDDLKELVVALGKKRFILIGHDWGALQVWSFVDVYGDMVEKFVTMSGPSARVWLKLLWSEWWQFAHAWYVFFFQGPYLAELMFSMDDFAGFANLMKRKGKYTESVTQDDVDAYKYTFGKPGALSPAVNYYRSNFLQQVPRRKVDKVPKGLFVLGERDDYISKSSIPLLEKNFEGLKTTILPEERHFIQQECPDKVNKLIRDFLEG